MALYRKVLKVINNYYNTVNGSDVPTTIKTVAASGDYFIGVDGNDEPYKISKADLLAGLSSGGSSGSGSGGSSGSGSGSGSANSNNLTYLSDGDANGLFYYLGTKRNTTAWSNPAGNGLTVTASAVENGSVEQLCNRNGNDFWTPSAPNSWVGFYINSGKLICNRYSIKSREVNDGYYPRTWTLQGSNDNSTWTDLDVNVNNNQLNSPAQWLSRPVVSSVGYSFFRVLNVWTNSHGYFHLCLGEVELYGLYTL
jgi:hypothetical protein